ncbi:MAG: glycine--tRNA ligase subunit alpha [Rickettsiaceae bacterium H1]|nr:glycine--tRNA ligase subunit alpha [Rickettsiaceae bacterium H1]
MSSFQNIISTLEKYWSDYGCVILQPSTTELGAGTLHPATIFNSIGNMDRKIAYVQPVIRPGDGRYGKNPSRLYQHHQYQVLIKPSPENLQELYLKSLEKLGISLEEHDIRFVEDDWENPSVGAWGLGWEVWCDGMEISQFTYMQQVGCIECNPVPGELAYGLERLAMYIQNIDDVYQLKWNDFGITYGDIFKRNELELSTAALDSFHDKKELSSHIENLKNNCTLLLNKGLPLAAYDQCLKANHTLNLLDASGALGHTERASYILQVRDLVKSCCKSYVESANL